MHGRRKRKLLKRQLIAANPGVIKLLTDKMPKGEWFKAYGLIFMGTGPERIRHTAFDDHVHSSASGGGTLTLADIQNAVAALKANGARSDASGHYHFPLVPPAVVGLFTP